MRATLLAFLLLLLPATEHLRAAACLTTLSGDHQFTPPSPYDSLSVPDGMYWYGTSAFWTRLAADGVWHTTGNVDRNGGYVAKLFFWSRDFDWRKEPQPDLIITAQRLDADVPSTADSHASTIFIGGKPAMMIGLHVPSAGCWQVNGHYGDHIVTFVVSVEP